jgi:putative transposase
MKLIAQIKLQPDTEQHQTLKQTLEAANAACNRIGDYAWQNRVFGKYKLQKALYYDLKEEFGLSAQMVIRCLAKVSDAYELDKKRKRNFQPHGAIAYDSRILSYNLKEQTVSIWTLEGRLKIPFVAGKHQLDLLFYQQGESDLVYRNGVFYLFVTCNVEDPPQGDVTEFLGIDLGIKNIATDSDGESYAGNHLNNLRKRHAKLRKKLQSKGTRSAKRLLRKRRRKESRMAKNVNHVIAKKVVEKAKRHNVGIALENLTGIRQRVTVKRSQRNQHHSWSFYDLRQKIEYKATRQGIPVVLVDPRNTSRTCQICGCVDKSNRKSQAHFLCTSCGFSANADVNAACIIAGRAIVNWPNVSTDSQSGTSPRASAVGS